MNKNTPKAEYRLLLFLILLPIFFLLHAYNDFFGLLPIEIIQELLISYFSLLAGIFLITALLFKSLQKAFIYSFYLLSVCFFFGAFHDALKSFLSSSRLSSYSVLIPFLFMLSAILFIYIKKRKKVSCTLIRYLKLLLIVLTTFEIVVLVHTFSTGKGAANNLALPTLIQSAQIEDFSKPDIFFIVFDEYPSSESLRNHFRFINDTMDSVLKNAGFFTSYDSKSNYNFTSYSLASTLGLNYLRVPHETVLHEKQLLQSVKTVKENMLTRFLTDEGYDIINYGTYELKQDPVKTFAYFDDSYYKQIIDGQTLWSRIKKDIWWNFSVKDITTGEMQIPESFRKQKTFEIQRNRYNYQHTLNQIKIETVNPRFVFSHILLPHAPYFLNARGEPISDSAVFHNLINNEEAFLEQVRYANTLLKEIVSIIRTQKTLRPRVFVIEGDHGYRVFNQKQDGDRAFMNLNTYHFSDQEYSQLYDGISPVNSFRVVLNKYFNTKLPLLEDSSVYIIDPR